MRHAPALSTAREMAQAPLVAGEMAATLLEWYDRSARRLPWREPPGSGRRGDPYRIWLSEVMLQQTTVAAAKAYFEAFTTRWPRVEDLAAAEDGDVMGAWAGLGYYARARNLLACARTVAGAHGGRFPTTEAGLLALPGVGPYTAAAVAAIAFGRPAAVLDGNVERVMARVFAVETPLPAAKAELRALAAWLTPQARPGDYAQAVMDLGATICAPRAPACGLCPWRAPCAGRLANAADLPRRRPRAIKPLRFGVAYLALRPDGAALLETRPPAGLLGGMLGLPGTDWTTAPASPRPPLAARWRDAGAELRHTFTHFHLALRVEVARVAATAQGPGAWRQPTPALEASLPSVMRKALRLGLSAA